jgi:hypothetical protein
MRDFDLLLDEAVSRAPVVELVDIHNVGFACTLRRTPHARSLTSQCNGYPNAASMAARSASLGASLSIKRRAWARVLSWFPLASGSSSTAAA